MNQLLEYSQTVATVLKEGLPLIAPFLTLLVALRSSKATHRREGPQPAETTPPARPSPRS